MPLRQKLLTILLLWLTIGYTAGFAVSQGWAKLILLGVAIGVTVHLVRVKTLKPEARNGPMAVGISSSENTNSTGSKGARPE